jgi:hypothetical protein
MAFSPELVPLAAMYNNPMNMIGTATGAIALGATIKSSFVIVHEGEMGLRMRSGKPQQKKYNELNWNWTEEEIEQNGRYQIEGPGVYVLWPFDHIVKINVRDSTNPLPEFDVESSDNRQFKVHSTITWHVRDDGDNPYKAIFNVNNEKDNKDKDKRLELQETVSGICAAGLGVVLSGRPSEELIKLDHREVNTSTREVCETPLIEYGVALKAVQLKPITRTSPEVLKQGIESSNNPAIAGAYAAAASISQEKSGNVYPLRGDAA